MREGKATEETPPVGRLDDRLLTTLQGLAGRIAFSGLRRVLGAHPESLSRALRRLEREGLVERSDGGYRALVSAPQWENGHGSELRSIAQVELPVKLPPETVLGRLTGRWFGSLRWVGVIERPEGRLLAWARRDGSGLVLLGLRDAELRVYVSSPSESGDPSEEEDAAYELLFHTVEALRASSVAAPDSTVLFRALPAAPLGTPIEN